MKTYILNLTTYGMNGLPTDYDYAAAADLWNEIDELNENLRAFTVRLNETESGSLILSAEPGEEADPLRIFLETIALSRRMERIADEFGAFELPDKYLMGEPELNEIRAAVG